MTFDHLAISVDAIAASIAYYRDRFPHMSVLYEDSTWALVQIDSVKIAFVIEDQHPPHMAFRIADREELDRLAAKFQKSVAIHRDGSESFYDEDPSGNAVEFIYYPPKGA